MSMLPRFASLFSLMALWACKSYQPSAEELAALSAGSYVADWPCADCDGIRQDVRLGADGTYIWRSQRQGGAVESEEGTWRWPRRQRLVLRSASGREQRFELLADGGLQLLDKRGRALAGYVLQVSAQQPKLGAAATAGLHDIWVLERLDGALPDTSGAREQPYIEFNTVEGRVMGQGGCNQFSGHLSADAARLSISQLVSTRMACPALRTETAFFAALREAVAYRVEAGRLILSDEAGTVRAVLRKVD